MPSKRKAPTSPRRRAAPVKGDTMQDAMQATVRRLGLVAAILVMAALALAATPAGASAATTCVVASSNIMRHPICAAALRALPSGSISMTDFSWPVISASSPW